MAAVQNACISVAFGLFSVTDPLKPRIRKCIRSYIINMYTVVLVNARENTFMPLPVRQRVARGTYTRVALAELC
jgi:hypothetical protein